MKSVGIVCECNPFHTGHKHLIECAKASGADAVVCVMSGCFVQRGEAAIADPYSRARALILGGADLVLELPFPYAASSAEFFADAGVDILSRLGVETLWFGSECGTLAPLERAARTVGTREFLDRYTKQGSDRTGTAQAFFEVLREMCGEDGTYLSNDILGIAYLRAIQKRGDAMRAETIAREGSAYRAQALCDGAHPSATALRKLILDGGMEAARDFLLPETADVLQKSMTEGLFPASLALAERAVLAHLRMMDAQEAEAIAELGGGLGSRLLECACRATSLESLIAMASTKKYTAARLLRGILFAMTGVLAEDIRRAPSYVRMLAANERGCAFLAEQRKQGEIPVVTRNAQLPQDASSQRQEMLHRRALSLYSLCLPQAMGADIILRKTPWILK